MLTTGQLTAHTAVMVRAIRHCHQRGKSGHLAAVALTASHIAGSPPAGERMNELSRKRLGSLRGEARPA